jgi:hypothetical protein
MVLHTAQGGELQQRYIAVLALFCNVLKQYTVITAVSVHVISPTLVQHQSLR